MWTHTHTWWDTACFRTDIYRLICYPGDFYCDMPVNHVIFGAESARTLQEELNTTGLDLFAGHAGSSYVKLANGATASLSVYIMTVCLCLLLSLWHRHSCSTVQWLSVTLSENYIITGFNTLWTHLCGTWYTMFSCFLLCNYWGFQNI